jgi:hypothetical protein
MRMAGIVGTVGIAEGHTHTQADGTVARPAEHYTQAVGTAEGRTPVFDTAARRTTFQKN